MNELRERVARLLDELVSDVMDNGLPETVYPYAHQILALLEPAEPVAWEETIAQALADEWIGPDETPLDAYGKEVVASTIATLVNMGALYTRGTDDE